MNIGTQPRPRGVDIRCTRNLVNSGVPPGATLSAAYHEALLADAPTDGAAGTSPALPTGAVTLIFTDLVRSTELAERLGRGILVSDVVRSLTSRSLPMETRVVLNLKGLANATMAWQVLTEQ